VFRISSDSYKRQKYDNVYVRLPKGYLDVLKAKADSLGMSVNAFTTQLIVNEINGTTTNLTEQRTGFNEEQRAFLKKIQVPKKYFDMVEDCGKAGGMYCITLKVGFVNDITGNRYIQTKTTHDLRMILNKSHKVGEDIKRLVIEKKKVPDWLSDADIKQLERWQVPGKYWSMIKNIRVSGNEYNISLLDGFINDLTGQGIVIFKNVQELRKIIKYTHRGDKYIGK